MIRSAARPAPRRRKDERYDHLPLDVDKQAAVKLEALRSAVLLG